MRKSGENRTDRPDQTKRCPFKNHAHSSRSAIITTEEPRRVVHCRNDIVPWTSRYHVRSKRPRQLAPIRQERLRTGISRRRVSSREWSVPAKSTTRAFFLPRSGNEPGLRKRDKKKKRKTTRSPTEPTSLPKLARTSNASFKLACRAIHAPVSIAKKDKAFGHVARVMELSSSIIPRVSIASPHPGFSPATRERSREADRRDSIGRHLVRGARSSCQRQRPSSPRIARRFIIQRGRLLRRSRAFHAAVAAASFVSRKRGDTIRKRHWPCCAAIPATRRPRLPRREHNAMPSPPLDTRASGNPKIPRRNTPHVTPSTLGSHRKGEVSHSRTVSQGNRVTALPWSQPRTRLFRNGESTGKPTLPLSPDVQPTFAMHIRSPCDSARVRARDNDITSATEQFSSSASTWKRAIAASVRPSRRNGKPRLARRCGRRERRA